MFDLKNITFFSIEISEVCTFLLFLRLLHPARDGGVVDSKLLGRFLESVVNCKLPHLLLEPEDAALVEESTYNGILKGSL